MLQKLKAFCRSHEKTPPLSWAFWLHRKGFAFRRNMAAIFRLRRLKRKEKPVDRPIRVCFLQQDPNCWNKSKALYDLLQADDRFQVTLLCVPDPFAEDTASTYRFFASTEPGAIDARIGEGPWSTTENLGDWFDLQSLQPDYVFYQQPYDAYLPQAYQSTVVSGYAKICITPYGFALTKELLECSEYDFYQSVYNAYSVSPTEKDFNTKRFALSHKIGIRHTKYLGTLVFSDLFSHQEEQSPSWDFSKNSFRAIWTPRWTTDPKIGGSNFFRYMEFFPNFAKENPTVDILFRPHPMAFSNFVRNGQMTQDEVDAYIGRIEAGANTALDQQKRYDATFWQSNVLVTDISAIIIEYFATGKPIIFCETQERLCTYLDFFEEILSVCYVAQNQEDVSRYLLQLQAGDDPLQPARIQMLHKLFGEDLTATAAAIAEDLIADSSGK